jgi:hypothetical protein
MKKKTFAGIHGRRVPGTCGHPCPVPLTPARPLPLGAARRWAGIHAEAIHGPRLLAGLRPPRNAGRTILGRHSGLSGLAAAPASCGVLGRPSMAGRALAPAAPCGFRCRCRARPLGPHRYSKVVPSMAPRRSPLKAVRHVAPIEVGLVRRAVRGKVSPLLSSGFGESLDYGRTRSHSSGPPIRPESNPNSLQSENT